MPDTIEHTTKPMTAIIERGLATWKKKATKILDADQLLGGYATTRIAGVHLKPYHYRPDDADRYDRKREHFLASGNIYVETRYQGHGVLREILNWMESEAKRRNFAGVLFYTVWNPLLADILMRRNYKLRSRQQGLYVLVFPQPAAETDMHKTSAQD